jgi:Co/Zn/Cd efflux system component
MMQHDKHPSWQHGHTFGQDQKRPGEVRTIIVIAITGVMMVVEIATGILFGSMALLADGLHMASHAAALSINVFAYSYARRYAHDRRYTFGTGKVNALDGFTGAILISRWSFGLIRDASGVLLDKRGSEEIITKIKKCIEKNESNRISDLHLWSVGPKINAVIVTVVTSDPKSAEHYKQFIPSDLNLVHVTVEVHQRGRDMGSEKTLGT